MTREIRFGERKPSAVDPAFYRVKGKGELLTGGNIVNWFELPVDGRRITNRDTCWNFDEYTTRPLTNGGTEIRIRFRGSAPLTASLEWDLIMQAFPHSTICREKVVFRARPGMKARLGAPGPEALFVFPGYRFRRETGTPTATQIISLAGWGEEVIPTEAGGSFDDRTMEEGTRVGRNLAQNYMYHPAQRTEMLTDGRDTASPGPILLLRGLIRGTGLLFAYEHGAPDHDPEQEYLLIRRKVVPESVELRTEYARGAYCRNQTITDQIQFESVWNVLGAFDGPEFSGGASLFYGYLQHEITESARSREHFFYYNTWAMQRDEERKGLDVRDVLTVERVTKEIELARKLNVDIFVLDDGWQDRFGDWNPDPRRYTNGLQWYVRAVVSKDMIPGLWFAAMATDSAAEIALKHPEWLIRDEDGRPVVGRWQKHIFCFDSDYRKYFLQKCKDRIDEGIRYFKWDGIDKHLCASPLHHHGDEKNSPEERRQKQGYDLPLLVADAIRQLREYRSDVVVEIDVTEPHRSVGLAILSEGKYYWMNNGASWYGDYSTHRSKSMRNIPNLFYKLFPPSLQTYANYPHDNTTYSSWRNNVNSSLIAGWGYWGNLALIDSSDLERTAKVVALSKKILRSSAALQPKVTGRVGGTTEIYELVDRRGAVGQVVAFSGSAHECDYVIQGMQRKNLLAVLHQAYSVGGDSLILPFRFPMPEAAREAFILSNEGRGMSVIASTSWLQDAYVRGADTLVIIPGAAGRHEIEWDSRLGIPVVESGTQIPCQIAPATPGAPIRLTVTSTRPGMEICIIGNRSIPKATIKDRR
ncbi:MAG: hypothetical protein H6Q30_1216 [Bacteroidetes bacterium]|jgi:hypothetical protein|nr:hypothetical protein [Bacteroidota bacterium]